MSTATSTSLSPTARQIWTRARGLLLAAAVLAVAGVAIAAVRSSGHHGALDPRSADRYGSRAAAELLSDRGIDTEVVTTANAARAAAGPDSTLLVAAPETLSRHQRTLLRAAAQEAGRTVLVAPGPSSTADLARGVRAARPTEVQPTPPDCDFPAAERAGDAELGGIRYSSDAEPADACYLHQGLPTLLRLPHAADGGNGGDSSGDPGTTGQDTVLLGAPDPLHNDRLDERGNASLTLQLLGSRPHLVWYLPSASDSSPSGNGDRSFFALLPDGWSWAALQLSVAALLTALWRARRLGPLVPERLPVSVRASETTEGRARLYRKARARDRAAEALRSATRSRLAPLVGVPLAQAHTPAVLVPAITSRTAAVAPPPSSTAPSPPGGVPGVPSPAAHNALVSSLLFGPVPSDDAALIQLADDLDRLEQRFTATESTSPTSTDKDRTS